MSTRTPDDIKVEIPETGVSIGEAYRFLRSWLGHETHISGEVNRTATGIALAARIGTESSADFTGAESDLDAMMQKAAERLYGITQPYRYGAYLGQQGRPTDAYSVIVLQALAKTGPLSERAWAYNGLGVNTDDHDIDVLARLFGRAVELDPTNAPGHKQSLGPRTDSGPYGASLGRCQNRPGLAVEQRARTNPARLYTELSSGLAVET